MIKAYISKYELENDHFQFENTTHTTNMFLSYITSRREGEKVCSNEMQGLPDLMYY